MSPFLALKVVTAELDALLNLFIGQSGSRVEGMVACEKNVTERRRRRRGEGRGEEGRQEGAGRASCKARLEEEEEEEEGRRRRRRKEAGFSRREEHSRQDSSAHMSTSRPYFLLV